MNAAAELQVQIADAAALADADACLWFYKDKKALGVDI